MQFIRILIFIIVLLPVKIYPNWLDEIGKCFSNPCTCGQGKVHEKWGTRDETFDEPANCPPFNKNSGRSGCILQFNYPPTVFDKSFWNRDNVPSWYYFPGYLKYCAQATRSTNYFNPKLTIKVQNCNAAACWPGEATLGVGDCFVHPTTMGVPLLRICARIAVPAAYPVPDTSKLSKEELKKFWCAESSPDKDKFCSNTGPKKDDPGYTRCYSLNYIGETVEDQKQKSSISDCNIRVITPKLCAYVDPSVTSLSGYEADLFDFNPVRQPLHSGGIFPLEKILVSLLESGVGLVEALYMLEGKLADAIGLGFAKDITTFLGKVVQFFGDKFTGLLKEIFALNREVFSDRLGCVELPLGPYPPPYCSSIDDAVEENPIVEEICTRKMQINDSVDSFDNPGINCVLGSNKEIVNNAISNSLRIGYTRAIPLCSSGEKGESDYLASRCIKVKPTNVGIEITRSSRDILPSCTNDQSGKTCVLYKGCDSQKNSPLGCSSGFRVLYTSKMSTDTSVKSSSLNPTNFDPCLPDCDNLDICPSSALGSSKENCCSGSKMCQTVWGVDVGDFTDLSLTFPQQESGYTLSPIHKKSTLKNKDYIGLITRANQVICKEYLEKLESSDTLAPDVCDSSSNILHEQNTNEICAYLSGSNAKLIGCTKRDDPPVPVTLRCKYNGSGDIDCKPHNHFIPSIGIKLEVKENDQTYSTQGVVSGDNFHTTQGYANLIKLNLAGLNYSAFITDLDLTVDKNPGTFWGHYKDKALPMEDGKKNPSAIYFDEMEYVNNKYVAGGNYVCAVPPPTNECPLDKTKCVLSKIYNPDGINCNDKTTLPKSDPALGRHSYICEVSQTNQSRLYPPPSSGCSPSSANYPECLKLSNTDYFDIDNPELVCTDKACTSPSTPGKKDILFQVDDNGAIDLTKVGSCSDKQLADCKIIKYVDKLGKALELRKCANNEVCSVEILECSEYTLSHSKQAVAINGEVSIIDNPKDSSKAACLHKIEDLCRDDSSCSVISSISYGGNVVNIKYCTRRGSLCKEFKVKSCNEIDSKNIIKSLGLEQVEGSNLFWEFIEKKEYLGDLNNPDTKGICGLEVQLCTESDMACPVYGNASGKDELMHMDDNNYYQFKKCPNYYCLNKLDPKIEINKNAKRATYDTTVSRLRSKNSFELGLCQPVPEAPKCASVKENNAVWEEAISSDKKVEGKCIDPTKYIPASKDALLRYCYFDPSQSADIHFDYSSVASVRPVFEKLPPNSGCIKASCNEELLNGVVWAAADAGETSTGKCKSPDGVFVGTKTTRMCKVDNGKVAFEPVTKEEASCVSGECAEETLNGVVWAAAKVGGSSTGKCKSAEGVFVGTKTTRMCKVDNGKVAFEPVTKEEASCVTGECAEETLNGVVWAAAKVGGSSTGKCKNSSDVFTGSKTTRICKIDKGQAVLETVSKEEASCAPEPKCPAEESGGVLWAEAKVGESSDAKCKDPNSVPYGTRKCQKSGDKIALEPMDNTKMGCMEARDYIPLLSICSITEDACPPPNSDSSKLPFVNFFKLLKDKNEQIVNKGEFAFKVGKMSDINDSSINLRMIYVPENDIGQMVDISIEHPSSKNNYTQTLTFTPIFAYKVVIKFDNDLAKAYLKDYLEDIKKIGLDVGYPSRNYEHIYNVFDVTITCDGKQINSSGELPGCSLLHNGFTADPNNFINYLFQGTSSSPPPTIKLSSGKVLKIKISKVVE